MMIGAGRIVYWHYEIIRSGLDKKLIVHMRQNKQHFGFISLHYHRRHYIFSALE